MKIRRNKPYKIFVLYLSEAQYLGARFFAGVLEWLAAIFIYLEIIKPLAKLVMQYVP